MPFSLTNSLSRKKEVFVPLVENRVRLYVCGPTVYNFIHIGNARPLVFFDVARRYLEFCGFHVTHIVNYTDVDDKIIDRAKKEGVAYEAITKKYIEEYQVDMGLLKVLPPTEMPKVSDHLPQIVKLIEGLITNGMAYAVEGEVFFSVRKFPDYGKLSGKNIDDLISGARVEVDARKKDPLDFSLWKPRKEASEPAWESPWGLGRPGWHIECSAMAMQYLGDTFDIHGGGMDLMHPHHENEIAQAEGFSHQPYARYWLHNNMLNINAEKMSKSSGNILLAREFIERYSAETLKFMLLSGHYRSVIDFSEQTLRDSQAALHRFYSTTRKCEQWLSETPKPNSPTCSAEEKKALETSADFKERWQSAMDDDLNTARVIGLVFDYVRAINAMVDKRGFTLTLQSSDILNRFLGQIKQLALVLNVFAEPPETYLAELRALVLKERGIESKTITDLIEQRIEARRIKDFAAADAIRQKFLEMGVEVRDRGETTEWDVIFKTSDTGPIPYRD